jgi:Tol biopolymer transport system component
MWNLNRQLSSVRAVATFVSNAMDDFRHRLWMAAFLIMLSACGGGSDAEPNATSEATGSLVYNKITQIGGQAAYGIHVTNLGTGRTSVFPAIDFSEGGVSVSRNGRIAQLKEGNDNVVIRVTDLGGQAISEFQFTLRNSFPLGGARISPDGTKVAFALSTQENGGQERVYFCNVQAPYNCNYYFNLRDPEWMPDGRIIGISTNLRDFTQLYVSNANLQGLNSVGPVSATRFKSPYALPDGSKVIVSFGAAAETLSSIDMATGVLQPLTSDGTGHVHPVVSADGRTVFYTHNCCSGPTGTTGLYLHAMPLNLNAVTPSPIDRFALRIGGQLLGVDSQRFGYTPAAQ